MALGTPTKSFAVANSGTSITVAEPSGAAQGELMFAFFAADYGSSAIVPGSGWSQIASFTGTNAQGALYVCTRGASAPGLTWSWTTSAYAELAMVRVPGARNTLGAFSILGPYQSAASSAGVNPLPIQTIADKNLALVFTHDWQGAGTNGWTAPSGYTGLVVNDQASQDLAIAYRAVNAITTEDPGAWSNRMGSGALTCWSATVEVIGDDSTQYRTSSDTYDPNAVSPAAKQTSRDWTNVSSWFGAETNVRGWFWNGWKAASTPPGDLSAALAATLGSVTASASGQLSASAAVTPVLAGVSASISGQLRASAALGATLGGITPAVTAQLSAAGVSATLAATLADVSATATAQLSASAALTPTLGGVAASAAGQLSAAGALAPTLSSLTPAVAAQLAASTQLAATLGSVAVSASGTLGGITSVAVAVTLADVSAVATAQLAAAAALNTTLGGISASVSAQLRASGAIATTLDGLQPAVSGQLAASGTASAALDGVAVSAVAQLGASAAVTAGLDGVAVSATVALLAAGDSVVAITLADLSVAIAGETTPLAVPVGGGGVSRRRKPLPEPLEAELGVALAGVVVSIKARAGSRAGVAARLDGIGMSGAAEKGVVADGDVRLDGLVSRVSAVRNPAHDQILWLLAA